MSALAVDAAPMAATAMAATAMAAATNSARIMVPNPNFCGMDLLDSADHSIFMLL